MSAKCQKRTSELSVERPSIYGPLLKSGLAYSNPASLVIPVEGGPADYLAWLAAETVTIERTCKRVRLITV
ncbi:MAG: hypothetical protein ACR2PG_12180 [Hyphomicrobiaceae bacterium]